jgi:hypothetical protein
MPNDRKSNFKRLAEARTNEVLRRLKILGNCANRSNYDYTEAEVDKIFGEIEKKVKEMKSKFTFIDGEEKFKL